MMDSGFEGTLSMPCACQGNTGMQRRLCSCSHLLRAASKGSDSSADVEGPTHPARSNTPLGLFIIPDSRGLK